MRFLSLLLLAAALAGCPTPRQYEGEIPVVPGAAARNSALMDRLHGPEQKAAKPARVHVLRAGEELHGGYAIGRPGDLVLENDEVVFVIDQLASTPGFAETGGNVVDAADARDRRDDLSHLMTYFGTFPRQAVYESLSSGVTEDGGAWVEARGHELWEPGLKVTTRYTLHGPDRALLMETTLKNASGKGIDKLALGDAIQWGGAQKIAPGKPAGFRGKAEGPYVGGVGPDVAYATTSTEGVVESMSGGGWTDTLFRKDVALKPWESVTYARVLVVAARPDPAGLVAELVRASGGELGAIDVALRDAKGTAIAIPPDARVTLSTPQGERALWFRAEEGGKGLGAELPPGRYVATYASGGGRAALGGSVTVDVRAGETGKVAFTLGDAGRLEAECVDAKRVTEHLPCKVTIEGLGGTPAPGFDRTGNQVFSANGVIDVPLAPGRYRVTASRGPEYALAQREIATGGESSRVRLALARVVDTEGYVACDFHQHSTPSADAGANVRERVTANAVEGVEVGVASEHNVVADHERVARDLALERFVVELPGVELTTDANASPWGHANAFPLAYDPTRPRNGAPDVRGRSPRAVFDEVRALPGPHVVQINHPRLKAMSYFDRVGFDPKLGRGTDPGYSGDFDAVEVWNGRHVEARETVLQDVLALLRTGHPVTPTGDSDTHGVVGEEPGYPRTYVRVKDDAHLDTWDAARSADLVRGIREKRDVVVTNGPFLRVSANGAPVGGIARGRVVDVKVHVEAAPWVQVDRIEILRANGERVGAAVAMAPGGRGARVGDVRLQLRAEGDDAFVVTASGGGDLAPVIAGDVGPWAVTGPIWIDADGDGKAMGRERESR